MRLSIDDVSRIGTIAAFGEHTVIVSCGPYRYVARKEELLILGNKLSPYKKNMYENITRCTIEYEC